VLAAVALISINTLFAEPLQYQTKYRPAIHEECMDPRNENGLVGVANYSFGNGYHAVVKLTIKRIKLASPAASPCNHGVRD
jgi:hypothetical protein